MVGKWLCLSGARKGKGQANSATLASSKLQALVMLQFMPITERSEEGTFLAMSLARYDDEEKGTEAFTALMFDLQANNYPHTVEMFPPNRVIMVWKPEDYQSEEEAREAATAISELVSTELGRWTEMLKEQPDA